MANLNASGDDHTGNKLAIFATQKHSFSICREGQVPPCHACGRPCYGIRQVGPFSETAYICARYGNVCMLNIAVECVDEPAQRSTSVASASASSRSRTTSRSTFVHTQTKDRLSVQHAPRLFVAKTTCAITSKYVKSSGAY